MSIETLRPNAVGDETNLIPNTGANWECVDEAEADEDTTYVYKQTGAAFIRDLHNIQDHSAGAGTINHVTVYARCRHWSGENQGQRAKIAIKTHNTPYEGDEETTTSSYANYSKQWATNPNTGSAWTWTEIDNLQAGVALKPANNYSAMCTQVYVEVNYGVTPKTSADAGSGADAYVSLEKTEAKSSSDTGSGVEGTPVPSAFLAGNETGSGIEALIARLLTGDETGTSVEVGNLLRAFFASELGRGSDSLIAKIETPTKGGGMKLWT